MNFKELYSKYFLQASVLYKVIIINVLVFVFFPVLNTIGFLFDTNLEFVKNWFAFPHDIFSYIYKPWTLITYGFLHSGFRHILFNMLYLYFFGQVFLNIHNGRRFLNVYFLGIVVGGLVYMLSYNLFPAFSTVHSSVLVGASAAVNAVMVAATVQSPNYSFKLMFLPFTFKLWWITVALLFFDVINIPNGNAGGHLAHLGGALIGYLYMTQLQKGNDIGKPVEAFMDWVVSLFKPKEKTRLKTVYKAKKEGRSATSTKAKATTTYQSTHSKTPTQQQIDAILDKISKSGYESLSKKEKDVLFKAGKN
ncbi:rhomboid family intramembrane serine protease [Aquimarina agarivorans]|uniref:rhomboid family intramembrane serine protease n=1 Tax=Aquimarina agarivorans TaxID=980584 RepID=UPI000248F868|nr:rhomboid family intramembrane serine protease [Aquimarina agarivorans]